MFLTSIWPYCHGLSIHFLDRVLYSKDVITNWTPRNDQLFVELLSRWNHHQDLRSGGADVGQLVESRVELDHARSATRRAL